MKNGAAGKKKIKEQPFPKGTPVVQPRFYQAGKKCGGKNRVRPNLGTTFTESPGEKCRFFFPLQISLSFFFFFENQFLEKLVFKTSFFNHPNTLLSASLFFLSFLVPLRPPMYGESFALSTFLSSLPMLHEG